MKGNFDDNKIIQGSIHLKNGNIYIGEFKDKLLTEGTKTYINGDTITGTFIGNMFIKGV